MASRTNDIISVYICTEDDCIQNLRRIEVLDDDNVFCTYDIKGTTFNDFKSRLEQGYIFIINCEHIHNFVTCFTMNFSEDSLSAVIVGNWHYEPVRGIQHSISLLNAEGEQQFRKRVADIRIGRGEQRPDKEWPLEGNTKDAVDTRYQRVPDDMDFGDPEVVTIDEETVPKEILYSSENEYSKMPTFGVIPANNVDVEVVTQDELVTESRFVEADTMLPPDSDPGAGVYVWEQACVPDGRNRIISTDPETILGKLQQDDGNGSFEKQILGQFLPQIGRDWGIKKLSCLLSCDSAKIRYSVIEMIEHICYHSNPSRISPDDFLAASEITLASIIKHIGDEKCVAQLSYILLLILSMVFLETIAKQNVFPDILGEKLKKYHRQLSELNPKQHISIRYFIEFLQYFMQCLVANIRDLNKGHWLQMENWDEILATSSIKAEYIRKMVPKFNPCDRISVMVLLLNLIHRLDDTDLPSQLLMDMVKEALYPTVAIRFKIRRSRSKQHVIAFLIARGCIHLLETKPLIEAQASEGLRKKIKDILLIVLDTKEHTKHMVSEQLKCLSFCKISDIQNLVAEKIVREGQFTDVCLHYICHKLKRTKVSLHCNNISRYKQEWATCPGNLGNMRIKAVCFVGNKDGYISKSYRTSRTSSRHGKKEQTDYDRDDIDNNFSTLMSLQKKDVHSNIVQLIAYQWKTDPKFFVVEEPKSVKLQEYLLLKRNHSDWLSDLKLIFIVKQALCAMQHLHDRCIIHRDLTSDRFKICPESLTLKLVDFRLAKETSKQDAIVCLNEETRLAIRWTAAESQVSDKYSFRSDVYMFGHLMLEIWTHGCWPFSEHHDKSTDNIMEMVVRGGLKPKQPRCVPNDVFKTMLPTWETEEKRISTKELTKDVNNLLEQYSERKGTRSSARQPIDEHYPPISKLQLERNHEPEYGVQTAVLSIKITKQKHYYNEDLYKGRTGIKIQHTDLVSDNEAHILKDTQGICTVSEALLPLSIAQTIPRLQELENLSGAIQLELNYDNDMHRELVFRYPKGKTLRDVAMAMTDVKSLLQVLLNTAILIAGFHNADWIMRSICTFDLWVAEEDKRVFPLRLSRCCAFPPSEDWIIDDVFRDRQNWLPIETLRDEEYTKEGDVYQFAMTVFEVFNILDLRGPEKHLLSSIPFASINKKTDLENVLLKGELPQRPSSCPDTLFAVLERCMSRERISRPKIQDVLSCIKNCIHSNKEKPLTGIKRQRMSTPKVNSASEYYVNANDNSIYKDPVATKHCGDKCEHVVSSIGINDRNDILSNDQSNYTNVSASKEMNDKEDNKTSINEVRNILSKNQNDTEDMSTSPISDSSIAEISMNEERMHWSKNKNVSVKDTDKMYPCVENDAYSYAKKETLPNIFNSSNQATVPVPERFDAMPKRRTTFLDRDRPIDVDVRRNTFHQDMKELRNFPDQINTISKKAPRLSKFSKLKLRLTRRFRSSKSHSAKHNGDTESRDGVESASSSNGTRSSSSGGSLIFCNDSTSGTSATSVEKETEDETVYEEIQEYDDVLFQYSLAGDMTYESDTSDEEEQDRFPLKEHNDSPRIKESYAISTTSIVTENDSPLQSGSMDIHTASLDEASHQDITFENDEIYESTTVSLDSLIVEEGEVIKPLDDRENLETTNLNPCAHALFHNMREAIIL